MGKQFSPLEKEFLIRTYINGLKDLLELLEGVPSEENITVIHTDQGVVYSSIA